MKIKRLALILVLSSSFLFATNPVEKTNPKKTTTETKQDKTIVGVAAANKNFSTLVAAVKAAGLVDVLNSEGPFTVFAPTNDAFNKLPEGTLASLLKPENKELLASILKYHLVAGKFNASDVVKGIKKSSYGKFMIKTVLGEKLVAKMKDGNVILKDAKGNKSKIILTDVAASNGVIHAIENVVMPK